MATWGERLTAYLEAKWPESEGWSWNKRAKKLGITAQSLSNWRGSSPESPPGELVSSMIEVFSEFDANYLFRDDWPAELTEKKPAPEIDQERAARKKNTTAYKEARSVSESEGPAREPHEILAGYFHFGERRIAAVMCFRATGEPAKFGGYEEA